MAGIHKILLSALLFISILDISAQEILKGLEDNPEVRKFNRNMSHSRKSGGMDTITIPFMDDFSDSYIIPKTSLWTDRHAYINNTYCIFPVSGGVATLDALDSSGSLYPNASINPFQADFLTSKPIDLALTPSDSVYMSFFYQQGGLGENPENHDSLLLDFYSVTNGKWQNIWSVPGDSSQKGFNRVMIRITDQQYLQKGFRFRFRNYASLFRNDQVADLRSNCDHWNIEYIKIDKSRSFQDTVLRDVTFVDPMLSLFKDYESVPWTHAESAHSTQRRPYIETVIMNHDTIRRNVKTSLEIKNIKTGINTKTPVTSNDFSSGDSIHFLFSYDHPFNFGAGDSGIFRVTAILGTDAFDYKQNDTLRYFQYFSDYYALDDGSSEAGYGLRGDGTKNASVAVKFNSYIKDSLRAVDIYFNHTFESLNLQYFFYMNIWDDNNGKPGNLLLKQIGMRPIYSDSLNKFVRYLIDTPIEITGVFYVGWQKTVDKLENVGFDKNRINNSRIFYTENGEWKNSSFPGSLMIRPVFGKKNIVGLDREIIEEKQLYVYPNPADRYIFLPSSWNKEGKDISVVLYDLTGRKIRSLSPGENVIFTGDLKEGIYVLKRLNLSEGYSTAVKVVISH